MKIFILFMCFVGCTTYTTVTITKDYVINPNWDKVDNAFEICKMKLKDSTEIIDLKEPSEAKLYNSLIKDTSFKYTAFVEYNGEDYAKRKVYFNRDNGFLWHEDFPKSKLTKKILGDLQQDTWYLLSGLSRLRTLYYIYLDTSDTLHVFKVSTMTNY